MKKRPFLLIEVLLAILLVSMCLIPLIRSPIESYRAEMRLLEEMEGERLAEWSFSEVKDKLLNHEIPWGALPSLAGKTAKMPLPPMAIELPGAKKKTIERFFVLHCRKNGEKEGKSGEIYRMMYVDIGFKPRLSQKKHIGENGDYAFRILVRKLPDHNFDKAL